MCGGDDSRGDNGWAEWAGVWLEKCRCGGDGGRGPHIPYFPPRRPAAGNDLRDVLVARTVAARNVMPMAGCTANIVPHGAASALRRTHLLLIARVDHDRIAFTPCVVAWTIAARNVTNITP